jgi:formimidoylglutamate deiminase
MKNYFADRAWSPRGWIRAVRIGVDGGVLGDPVPDTARADAEYLGRYVLPGMPNLHSHAFQRAMAGLAEKQTNPSDSFWTWRETMYAFAGRIGPDDLRAIAAQLYVEMLKAGYTHVCEFHYLHHQPDGKRYADPATMSLALIEAAQEAGIGLTLLPTLYMTGGFDGRSLSERQRRFGLDVEGYLSLLQQLVKMENAALRIGVAFHSLRAVPELAMREVLAFVSLLPSGEGARRADEGSASERRQSNPGSTPQSFSRRESGSSTPIHIHIAEQIGEVQDCLAIRNVRPVEWLLDNLPVDARWCLVHATHMSAQETQRLAESGAVAGLCPTTEANLGDGLFPLKAYMDENGTLGIGSDSHISVSPVEELRWLEYGQRLLTKHRNIAVSASNSSVGETLYAAALRGGVQAAGTAVGAIEAGSRADLIVLDDAAPLLAARDASNVVDTFIFAGNANLVRHVMANGEWVVRDFHHRDEERIAARYRDAVERLAAGT